MLRNKTLSAIVVVLLSAAGLAGQAGLRKPLSIICGPYLQSPTETSMTVMWITNRNSTGWVEYGKGDARWKKAVSSHDGLIDANIRIHKIRLSGLEPGAKYRYRISSTDILDFGAYKVKFGKTVSSNIYHFRTFDKRRSNYTFIAFTDIHEHANVLPLLLKVNGGRPYDFVVFLGDMISHIEREQQIVDFINSTVAHFSSRIPFIWVRGNHEARGKFARMLPRYIATPNGKYYYSFDHGPVHFVVLDTGEDKADSSVEYSGLVAFDAYRSKEAQWLASDVRSAAFRRARFRVALAHMPFPLPPPKNQPHGMRDGFAKFEPYFDRGGLDLLLAGHLHRYGIHEPVPGRYNYPVILGGAYQKGNRTLIRVEVSRDHLKATILRGDGQLVGVREIFPTHPGAASLMATPATR